VNYRLLYFFHGRVAAVIAHGITKEGSVPNVDINRAIAKKDAFTQNPAKHTFTRELA
jgi:hypothetical protein